MAVNDDEDLQVHVRLWLGPEERLSDARDDGLLVAAAVVVHIRLLVSVAIESSCGRHPRLSLPPASY